MPDAPLRPCAGGCGAKVRRGRCPACTHTKDTRRRVSRILTYSESWWLSFRTFYVGMLVSLGILPVCGATVPDGPSHNPSQCKANGLTTWASRRGSLHLHHEPPLSNHEQSDRAAVCDAKRIVLLCERCHSSETAMGGSQSVLATRSN